MKKNMKNANADAIVNEVINGLKAAKGMTSTVTVTTTSVDGIIINNTTSVVKFDFDKGCYVLSASTNNGHTVNIRIKVWWLIKMVKAVAAIIDLLDDWKKGIKVTKSFKK